MLNEILEGRDEFQVGIDFKSYLEAQHAVESVFKDKLEFCRRTINSLANCASLSSDISIQKLSNDVWKVVPVDVVQPTLNPNQRVKSSNNLLVTRESQDNA